MARTILKKDDFGSLMLEKIAELEAKSGARLGLAQKILLAETGTVEQVAEWKVEMVVADEFIHEAVKALKKAHPYETPAFEVWRLSDLVF